MDSFVGDEVYIVVAEEASITTIYCYDDIDETLACLAEIDPLEEPETMVFHGVLTKAESIPANIESRHCYVIVVNDYFDLNRVNGYLYESDCENDADSLALDVEATVANSISGGSILFGCEIENIFILYGYQLATGLSINRDSLDEETVQTCKTIAEKAIEIGIEYVNNQGE